MEGVGIGATMRTLPTTVWNRPPTLAVSELELEVLTFPFPVPFVLGTIPMDLAPDDGDKDEVRA